MRGLTPAAAYNVAIGAGVLMVSGGVGALYGAGHALIAAGALVLALTLYSAERLNNVRRTGGA